MPDAMTENILPQPRVHEPGPRSRETSKLHCHWTTTLPEYLLREQSTSLQLFYAGGVILWAMNFAMDVRLTPHGYRGPYGLLIEVLGALLAAAIAAYIRFGRGNHRAKIRLGVAAVVPLAFGLALLNSWTEQPTTMRPISPITVLILFVGMLAPGRTAPFSPDENRPFLCCPLTNRIKDALVSNQHLKRRLL